KQYGSFLGKLLGGVAAKGTPDGFTEGFVEKSGFTRVPQGSGLPASHALASGSESTHCHNMYAASDVDDSTTTPEAVGRLAANADRTSGLDWMKSGSRVRYGALPATHW